jgi:hypothetical protein
VVAPEHLLYSRDALQPYRAGTSTFDPGDDGTEGECRPITDQKVEMILVDLDCFKGDAKLAAYCSDAVDRQRPHSGVCKDGAPIARRENDMRVERMNGVTFLIVVSHCALANAYVFCQWS